MAEEPDINKTTPISSAQDQNGGSLIARWREKRMARRIALLKSGASLSGDMQSVAASVAAVVLASVVIISTFYFRPQFLAFVTRPVQTDDDLAMEYMQRALDLSEDVMNVEKINTAFKYLQFAMKKATLVENRNDIALVMSEYLITRAMDKPVPYALMAMQYLLELLDVETRLDIRARAYKSLVTAAYLSNDWDTMRKFGFKAISLITAPDERALVLGFNIDLCLKKGSWDDIRPLLAEADEFAENRVWHYDFSLRKAMAKEQVLLRDDWFAEWLKSARSANIETPDDETLRSGLFDDVVAEFKVLYESGVARIIAEALFRTGRLYFYEEQYENARLFFGRFLQMEPVVHQADTLLMMTKAARMLGKIAESEGMISTFLARFPWNETAEEEFLAIIEEGLERGRFAQTLDLIINYIRLPPAKNILSELHCQAGHIALLLERHEQAEEHYKAVVELNDDDDLTITAMLALANIRFELEDMDGAKFWLLSYLDKFPFEPRQGDALFALLDLEQKTGASLADIINIASTAANECPEDPRTLGALMVVAKKLEDMALPALAAEQYNKIALLYYVHKSTDPERADEQTALWAMLGNARCLMATGEYNKAGNALRELSLELGQGEVRAEALYLWAELAMNANQKHEARRRLEMVDENESSPATAAMIAAKLALLDMSEAERPAKVTERLVKALSGLDVEKHAVFINDACERGFGILANKRDVAGMRRIFDFAVANNQYGVLSIQKFNLMLGNVIMADSGTREFLEQMEKNKSMMQAVNIEPAQATLDLIERARVLEEYEVSLGKL